VFRTKRIAIERLRGAAQREAAVGEEGDIGFINHTTGHVTKKLEEIAEKKNHVGGKERTRCSQRRKPSQMDINSAGGRIESEKKRWPGLRKT